MKNLSSSIMSAFHDLTEAHPLWSHPFLVQCRAGQLTLLEVQVLAVQMYQFSKVFNRILAGVLSCCPDESAQLVILENLFDEMGQGDPNLAHPELFRRFTRAIGLDDDTLAAMSTEPETRNLIETYLNLPHQYGYLAALGAICFASEGLVSSLYTQLRKGIIGAAPFAKESLIFFDVHIDIDGSHAAKLASIIEPRMGSTEVAIDVNRAILEAMNARVEFFNGVQRLVSQSIHSDRPFLLLHV